MGRFGIIVKGFTNGSGYWSSITGRVIPKTQKIVFIPPCLTLSIIKYESREGRANRGTE